MRYDKIRASEITPHPQNPRRHPQFQRDVVAASFEELGQIAPIVININNGYLVDGEERSWLALDQDDDVELDVIYVDLTEEEHQKALLYLDHSASLAEIDAARLDDLLRDVNSDQPAIQQMLAELAENSGLYGDEGSGADDPGAQIDRAAELQEQWQVKRGDLWIIPSKSGKGEHRLLCGDSTNADDAARVMGGERADAMINDPPYGMRLDADFSEMRSKLRFAAEKHAFGGRKYDNVTGDHQDYDATPVRALFEDVKEQFWFGADYYSSTLGDTQHSGSWLVWDKRLDETMDKMFGSCFELIWSAQSHKRDIVRVRWAGIFGVEQEPEHERYHPNHKPVDLYCALLSRIDDAVVIVDCYCGAGSTIVACEQLGRQARAIEIEPKYVAVTLQRLADMGLTPELQTP